MFTRLLYNAASKVDHIQVESKTPLHISYVLYGVLGASYKNTFFINHEPLSFADGIAFSTTLSKGNSSVIEADMAPSELDDFNTFYAVSIPTNPEDFPNAIILPEKSHSILIYK